MTLDGGYSLGAEPSWLDDTLRAALSHFPEESAAAGPLPVAMLEEIDRAIDVGWPDGRPMTVDELAADLDTGDSDDRDWTADVTQEHTWPETSADEVSNPSHLHGWHHQDHSGHTDSEPEPHL